MNRKRPGQSGHVSRHVQNLIKRSINVNPHQTANLLKTAIPELSQVSISNVKRSLHDKLKRSARRALRKPMITRSHLRKRIAFCKMTKDWTVDQWNAIMCGDESIFSLNQRISPYVRRSRTANPTDSRFTTASVKHPSSVMI